MNRTYTQADRPELLAHEDGRVYRKAARIVAVQMTEAFTVRTDRGPMVGAAGDWLVTNHPDDDPGSDMWTISDERMRSTYVEQVEEDTVVAITPVEA